MTATDQEGIYVAPFHLPANEKIKTNAYYQYLFTEIIQMNISE